MRTFRHRQPSANSRLRHCSKMKLGAPVIIIRSPRRRGRAAGAGIRGRATREFVDSGGLLSYAAHYPDLYRRAAVYVDKIFKGEKPADLPIEQPAKFEMMVSLKAAKAARLPPRTPLHAAWQFCYSHKPQSA